MDWWVVGTGVSHLRLSSACHIRIRKGDSGAGESCELSRGSIYNRVSELDDAVVDIYDYRNVLILCL